MQSESPDHRLADAEQELRLFRQAQTGDFDAFEQLVFRLQGRVYSVVFRILGQRQDAEDVVQQTFLTLIEKIDTFRGESAVATWVFRIATNFALKVLRKKRGLPTVSLDDATETYASVPHPEYIAQWRTAPADLVQQAELRGLLDQAIAELDDKYRLVFVLRDLEELSTEETAETLGITASNVKVRLLRARLQLRERLTRVLGNDSTRIIPDHSHQLTVTSKEPLAGQHP